MNKKAQAAMEYLMTYGWAILVIAIIFAILFIYIKPFGAVESCVAAPPTSFSCQQVILTSTTGIVSAKITSGIPRVINITSIGCGQGSNAPETTTLSQPEIVSQGSYISALWGSSNIKCPAVGPKGSTYAGKLYINYTYPYEPSTIPAQETEVSFITVVQ